VLPRRPAKSAISTGASVPRRRVFDSDIPLNRANLVGRKQRGISPSQAQLQASPSSRFARDDGKIAGYAITRRREGNERAASRVVGVI